MNQISSWLTMKNVILEVGSTELKYCFKQNVHFLEAFRHTLAKKNCQNEERKKRNVFQLRLLPTKRIRL